MQLTFVGLARRDETHVKFLGGSLPCALTRGTMATKPFHILSRRDLSMCGLTERDLVDLEKCFDACTGTNDVITVL